jgi:formylglycine-generating enzyme required for sulfatase activity
MKTRHIPRRLRLIAAALLLASPLYAAPRTWPAGAPKGEPMSFTVSNVSFEFMPIPAGWFLMGSSSGHGDERPVHKVVIEYDFHIGTTEVTVRQFRAFVEATGYRTVAERQGGAWHARARAETRWMRTCDWRHPGFEQTDDHPVVCVSYLDATEFCQWLSAGSGLPIRLPTEAEWEYACRAGAAGDSAGAIEPRAWFDATSGQQAHPVGHKAPNAWGLYDMQGNASEWCEDIYRWHYGGAPCDGSADLRPAVPAPVATRRTLRGGSWCTPKTSCRYSYRCPTHQALRGSDTGFRIVCGRQRGGLDGSTKTPATGEAYQPLVGSTVPPALVLTIEGLTFDFARIDPGVFTMGSPHRYVDSYNWTYEMPAHAVRVERPYYIGVTEVTVEQFGLFVRETGYVTDAEKQGWAFSAGDRPWHYEVLADWRFPGFMQGEREPVTHLGWYDAVAFCQWLSEKTGRDIRLPSEAEWEYACRAGAAGEYAGRLDRIGWYLWNSETRTHPVAQKQPNAWGLYDMHGNVWEWVQDMWHTDCNDAPTDGSAWLDAGAIDPHGVTRGGSFGNPAWLCRSYIRMRTPLGCMVHYNNGLRLVCAVNQREDNHPPVRGADRRAVQSKTAAAAQPSIPGLVPVEVALPTPCFQGTPEDIRAPRIKPVPTEPGPPFLAPKGTKNVALGKPVSASDPEPVIGDLDMITDGDKEAADGSYVELGPGLQHVTLDLQSEYEIYGIRAWHYHKQPRVYFDVIVQVSNDPDFISNVQTVFNNDMDNSAGLGVGADMHYVDTSFGELFEARGACGRYVRLYSRGNTATDTNHYIEVEVYGRPAE